MKDIPEVIKHSLTQSHLFAKIIFNLNETFLFCDTKMAKIYYLKIKKIGWIGKTVRPNKDSKLNVGGKLYRNRT